MAENREHLSESGLMVVVQVPILMEVEDTYASHDCSWEMANCATKISCAVVREGDVLQHGLDF